MICRILLIWILLSHVCFAESFVIDKVYHPNVLPNEREFEWRLMSRQTDTHTLLSQRLAYGQSVGNNVMVEGYLIAGKTVSDDFTIEGYEVEVRWMLSEQGELWADWGVLFDVEKFNTTNDWELTSGLLFEKEIGRTSLTMNLLGTYEWGETLNEEIEVEFRLKYRYRWIPQVQPAIELYAGNDFVGLGPAFMGIQRFDKQKQLKWEAGFITELSGSGSDHSVRVSLEYEF